MEAIKEAETRMSATLLKDELKEDMTGCSQLEKNKLKMRVNYWVERRDT